MLQRFFHRHQNRTDVQNWLKVAIGGALGIGFVGFLSEFSGTPLLIAPFGATAVLLFCTPSSPLAQPMNVIAGHVVVSLLSITLRSFLPPEWWAIGLAVGAALMLMAMLRITHPPAGANPIVVFLTDPNFDFVVTPILMGSVVLVGVAYFVHRLPPHSEYPLAIKPTGIGEPTENI